MYKLFALQVISFNLDLYTGNIKRENWKVKVTQYRKEESEGENFKNKGWSDDTANHNDQIWTNI